MNTYWDMSSYKANCVAILRLETDSSLRIKYMTLIDDNVGKGSCIDM